jgi:hypothetical protein
MRWLPIRARINSSQFSSSLIMMSYMNHSLKMLTINLALVAFLISTLLMKLLKLERK